MVKGVLLGSVSGLALSGLLVVAVSLLAPPPGSGTRRPVVAQPGAPILRDQSEARPRQPEPLPERTAAVAPRPVTPEPQVSAPGTAEDGQTLVPIEPIEPIAQSGASDANAQEVGIAVPEPGQQTGTDSGADGRTAVAAAVPLPSGSQFNRPPEDRAIVAPEAEPAPRTSALAEPLRAGAGPADAPVTSTESAAQPQTGEIAGFGASPEADAAPNLPARVEEIAPRTFGEIAEAQPVESTEEVTADGSTVIVTRTVVPVEEPEPPQAEEPVAVEEEAPEPEPEPEAEPEPAETAAPAAQAEAVEMAEPVEMAESVEMAEAEAPTVATSIERPEPEAAEASGGAQPPQSVPEAEVPRGAPDVIALVDEADIVVPPAKREPAPEPSEEAGDEADAQPEAAEEPAMPRRLVLDSEREEQAAPAAQESAPAKRGALEREAEAFSNPGGLPLLSVVLIDDPSQGIDRESLAALDYPVTFAIDPTLPGAGDAARLYREAGHEVVLIADALAPGGSAQDVEVAFGAARASVPQALGVLDTAGGDFVRDRDALTALLPALAEAGMGFVAYPGGLNSGVTAAQRGGVPATTVYRVLDEDDERATVIARYLDRATFEAAQSGGTVVIGRTSTEMITALYTWQQGSRAASVAAAPLSAVLTAGDD